MAASADGTTFGALLGDGRVLDLAWAPDGQSIAGLVWQDDRTQVLERWDLAPGVEKPIARRVIDNGVQVEFSPDGRHLFVGVEAASRRLNEKAARRRFYVFDADTLEPVEAPHLVDAWVVAGGETFVSAEQYTVDLVDTATLRPLRRLYEGPSPPKLWPAVIGLAAWLSAFVACLVRRRR